MSAAKNSWVHTHNDSDFSINNIPFGIIKPKGKQPRAATVIGTNAIDLSVLCSLGCFDSLILPEKVFSSATLNDFFALGRTVITAVRNKVIEMLSDDAGDDLKEIMLKSFVPLNDVELLLPLSIPNYTDFYSSEEHASNVGSMFRDPKNPLLPNWKHLPVAYHGRASSIVVSGTEIYRPLGQMKRPDQDVPEFGPSRRLDFELEVAFVSCAETKPGDRVSVHQAENDIAGFVLFNDWSARDIQQWEYVPLGPFLGKNFASTISPWVVTLDALEAFRTDGPHQQEVLSYLRTEGPRNFDVMLEVMLQPGESEPVVVCRSNMKYLYWNANQQLAHHTINGCNIKVGDVFASGTISGPSPGSYGSMLELSWNGKKQLSMPDGTVRTFLEDGDTVIMRGYAERNGIRVGFGECRGTIIQAKPF